MWGSRHPIGSLMIMLLMLGTLLFMASVMPDKQDGLTAVGSVIALFVVLLAEVLMLCYFHYGEKPREVWRRVMSGE